MDVGNAPRLLAWVAVYGYLALFLVLLLEELGLPLPLPGDLALLFVGYLVGRGMMRFDLAVLTVVLAALGGGTTLYLLARRYGQPMVARYGRYVHLDADRLARFEARSRRLGLVAVLVARLTPGMRIYTSLLAGLGGVSYARFLAALGSAALIWALTFIFLGSRVGEGWDELAALLEHHAVRAAAATGVLLLLAGLGWAWWTGRPGRRARRSGSPQASISRASGPVDTLDHDATHGDARALDAATRRRPQDGGE